MEKRHYEVLLLLRPAEDAKIKSLVDKYTRLLKKDGEIQRMEQWGIRPLAYAIQDHKRGFYVLINTFCSSSVIEKLEELFRFEEELLRFLIMRCRQAQTEESPVLVADRKAKEEKQYPDRRGERERPSERRDAPTKTEASTRTDWSGENVNPDEPAAPATDTSSADASTDADTGTDKKKTLAKKVKTEADETKADDKKGTEMEKGGNK